MRIITTYFNWGKNATFSTLLALMEKSFAAQNIPLESHEMKAPKKTKRTKMISNHEKLKYWKKLVVEAEEDIILLDTDIYCQRDFRDGFEGVKHIGLTFRPKPQYPPFNGGVVFVRNTDKSKEFFREWVRVDKLMYRDTKFHQTWRNKYEGMNQASAGYLMENGWGKHITRVECNPYNCVEPWDKWQSAKLIHIKGDLRDSWLGKRFRRNRPAFVTLVNFLREETQGIYDFDVDQKQYYWICMDLKNFERKAEMLWFFLPSWKEIGIWPASSRRFGVCKTRGKRDLMRSLPYVRPISEEDYNVYMSRIEEPSTTGEK